jgi:alkyl hydroperoxide reductase subunit AhpC
MNEKGIKEWKNQMRLMLDCQNKCRINQTAPNFKVESYLKDEFSKIELHDNKEKWIILFFYPLDFTFVCPTELVELSNNYNKFQNLNTEILGISCDSKFTHHAWSKTKRNEGGIGDLNFPLLADINCEVSKAYDVLLSEDQHPCRATFIIDSNLKIRYISMNDPPVGRNINELIRLIEGYQYTDEHGEVCPVNWNKGDSTIKNNPVDKLEYFNNVN